jgi:MerR family transcriptional regulator/heat shock protein HspR
MSVAADLVGMHPQTLRKYERAGLIRPLRYDGYHRMYSDEDLARLNAIRELAQAEGVNVAGLRVLSRMFDVVTRLESLLDDGVADPARIRAEVRRLRELLRLT